MKMVDVRGVIASLFIMLKEDTYVLMRIEILVALVTAMFLVMFIMDFYRCRSRGSFVITALKTVDGLSDQIVVYLLGVMQSAEFENHLFPVWAIVLVSLRASLGYLSGYGIPDRERRINEMVTVTKFMGVGLLTGTRALRSLWAILLLRSMYRSLALQGATDSLWHGRSSEFHPGYMRSLFHNTSTKEGTAKKGKCEGQDYTDIPESSKGEGQKFQRKGTDIPESSKGEGQRYQREDTDIAESSKGKSQKYLIYGEYRQNIDLSRPTYTLNIANGNSKSLITLDKVSEYTKNSNTNSRYKDMSIAFTLSRLLRCRLEDVTLHREKALRTLELITSEVTGDGDAERAFRILELEIAFVRDYFYTLYPMIFWQGLISLCFSLLFSMATFAVAFFG